MRARRRRGARRSGGPVGAGWRRRRGAPAARAERDAGARAGQSAGRAWGSRAAAHTGQGGGARRRRRSAGGGAGRPRGGAARGPGRPSGLGARGRGEGRRPGRSGGVRAETAARPRRRGGAAAAIAPESKGETDGEQEEVAGDLTGGSFCAKEGRRKIVGGEGRSSASETSTSSSARFCSLLRGRRREERDGTGSFKAFARIRAPTPRSSAIADAWRRRRRAQSPVWPASVTVETLSLQ